MSSGKTGRIHSLIGKFIATHTPYEVFKPFHDIRDSVIKPRGMSNGDAYEATVIKSFEEIDAERLFRIGKLTLLIDEIFMLGYDENRQPIPDAYYNAIQRLGRAGITRVFASGLNIAASGHVFPVFSDAERFGADIVYMTADCGYPENGDNDPTCCAPARNSQIWSKKFHMPIRPTSLPDLLPEGYNPDLEYIPVCPKHNILAYSEDASIEYIELTELNARVA
jgi:hypothetical protein